MWKQIRKSVYEISNTGVVRNRITKREIKTQTTNKGYVRVGLRLDKNEPKKYRVNRLVAEVFIENYDEKLEVHHINNLRNDNRVENLMCVTSKYNLDQRKFLTVKEKTIELIKNAIEIAKKDPILTPEEIYEQLPKSFSI